LNITSVHVVFQTKYGEPNNPNGLEQHYYVERPHVLVGKKSHVEEAPHVINIVQPTPKLLQDAPISEDFTKKEI
jgi:hypothetical protein